MKTSVAIDQPNEVAMVRTREFERKQSSGATTGPLVAADLLATSEEWQPNTTVPVATKMNRLVHTNSAKKACMHAQSVSAHSCECSLLVSHGKVPLVHLITERVRV